MTPGLHNSSLTRVQPFFEQLFERDDTGESWLARLVATAARTRDALGQTADEPGWLASSLLGPHPRGKAPRAGFEYDVPPPKAFLRWLIEHPDELRWPPGKTFGVSTTQMRRALLYDESPGRKVAQAEAVRLIEHRDPTDRGWWRFEGMTSIDCLIATDRLVISVEGKRTEPLSAFTDWYPEQTQLVRNLEAARQIARGRSWATLLISEELIPDGSFESVAASLDRAAPHLSDGERAELQAAYLGNVTWIQVCEAVDVDHSTLPHTLPERPAE